MAKQKQSGPPPKIGRRFLSFQDLQDRGIRFQRPHLRRLEDLGHFPRRIELGVGNGIQRSIAWVASEIEAWENERVAKRDAKVRATKPAQSAEVGA
jgi:predicted DNA-binding transcriptional regulator AlpA